MSRQNAFLSWAHWWQDLQFRSQGHDQGTLSVAYSNFQQSVQKETNSFMTYGFIKPKNRNVEEMSETNSSAWSIFL